jgi:16S rRNA (cytosine967-C5)-methyltransferase
MAAAAGDRARIVAADVRKARIQLLRDTVRASGARGIQIVQADLEAGLPFSSAFDIVFVDAPCSGLGTVRRDPDIRWRREEGDLPRFASAQRRMIDHAAAVVRPGGRLVYSTCSSEPDENEAVVSHFLAGNPGFRQIDLKREEAFLPEALRPVITDAGVVRTAPDAHGLEAFFGTVLRRELK